MKVGKELFFFLQSFNKPFNMQNAEVIDLDEKEMSFI